MGSVSLAQMFDSCGTMGVTSKSGAERLPPPDACPSPDCAGVSVMEPSMPVPGDNTPEPRSGVLLALILSAGEAARWHRDHVDRLVKTALDAGVDSSDVARAASGLYL